ncbi:ATP-NAD kinase-like domain-containing protein [Gorgonomyces haynaldii]|nr:ATP-NAD kinase-like domain-containing protein [Gorgonomyces haynaldii]
MQQRSSVHQLTPGNAMVRLESPQVVMVVSRGTEPNFVVFTRELAKRLMNTEFQCSLEPSYGLQVYLDAKLKDNPLFGYQELVKNPVYKQRLKFWTPEFCATEHDNIDFVITLGGDGTILYTAWLFQHSQVPPILPFHLGSLGFLTAFPISDISDVISRTVGCDGAGVRINLRMRLCCTIWRHPRNSKLQSLPGETRLSESKSWSQPALYKSLKGVPHETFHILNDLVVDRGPSAYMASLELYVDEKHLTTSQADGLVIATPTGSTAYSLAAGGSLVHPEVPSFLMTPICAHSLSFRPMLLPDSVELKIQVPLDSRNTAWASFDGRHRIELKQGDAVTITMSRYPVPSVCQEDQTSDWFESLRRCLHWNERTRQKPFNPLESKDIPPVDQENLSLEQMAAALFDVRI